MHKNLNKDIIHLDEYVAYMDKDHPLAQKEALDWSDLADSDLAIFNKTFTTLISSWLETSFTNAHKYQICLFIIYLDS